MRNGVEFLRARRPPPTGVAVLNSLLEAVKEDGMPTVMSANYQGRYRWLVLFGVGNELHDQARHRHIKAGGRVLHWDMGYFGRQKPISFARFSINTDHPQALLQYAPLDSKRLDARDLRLREDADPTGHIVLVGLGEKQRAYLGHTDWETTKFKDLSRRFPNVPIVYRPKKSDDKLELPCARSAPVDTIEDVIRGARLVVCRHSNVAVDATVAGVPFEAEDGAAMWLNDREFTAINRLEFLVRLCWFNWHWAEARAAWEFIKRIPV